MNRPLLLTLLFGLLSASASADTAAPILPAPQQVGAHSWAWIGPYGPPTKDNRGFRMNLGFIVGAEAVAVIDSGYGDPMAQAILEAIRAVTGKPIGYVIKGSAHETENIVRYGPDCQPRGSDVALDASDMARSSSPGAFFGRRSDVKLANTQPDTPAPS